MKEDTIKHHEDLMSILKEGIINGYAKDKELTKRWVRELSAEDEIPSVKKQIIKKRTKKENVCAKTSREFESENEE